MKRAFILVELLISIAIGSVLAITIFAAYNQIVKSSNILETVVEADSRAMTFQMIFENDLSGAFQPDVEPIKIPKPGQKQKRTEGPIFLENSFVQEFNENQQIKLLSFVTCNPLKISDEFRPRISTVYYYLEEDKNQPRSFVLVRNGTMKIEFSENPEGRKYPLIDNIKSLKLDYAVIKRPSKEDKTTVDEYVDVQKLNSKDNTKVPSFVTATLELWKDYLAKTSQVYTFKIQIYAATTLEDEVIEEQEEDAKKT